MMTLPNLFFAVNLGRVSCEKTGRKPAIRISTIKRLFGMKG
jgi:hypothetical protein